MIEVAVNADAIRARCQTLVGFVKEAWRILEPTARYIHSWHVEAICLPYGGTILTRDGPKAIGDIVESAWNGEVLSFNHATGRTEWRKIIRRMKSAPAKLVRLTTNSGASLVATSNHPVYICGEGYSAAGNVRVGQALLELSTLQSGVFEQRSQSEILFKDLSLCSRPGNNAKGQVNPLQTLRDDVLPRARSEGDARSGHSVFQCALSQVDAQILLPDAVYNLEIEGNNNYFADGVLVHNCNHLEAVTDGRITRLLINVPPGSMKSLLVSVLWPAWEWGVKGMRSTRYLTTAFNDGPVKRDSRKCRDVIQSNWYQMLWPEVKLVRAGELSFANSDTGVREGVPFGSLTSQRGDRLIIDDPHSIKTAESESERDNITRLFREGSLNRLNDQARSAIVIVMQRLHEKDMSGVILSMKMPFVHLMIPMEFERDRACHTDIGFNDPRAYTGELMCPERWSQETLDGLLRDMGSYAFAGQYQQRPAPREGGMFKRRWFGEPVQAAPTSYQKVRAWDLAATEAGGDWTVGVKMSRDHTGVFYIEHVERLRGSSLDVETAILNLAASSNDGRGVTVRLPQDGGQAGKAQVEAFARLLAGWNLEIERETGSKEVRAMPFAAQCEAGNVRLVAGPWVETFLQELENFPMGSHDDQVDAASGAFTTLVNSPALVISNEALRRAGVTGGMRRR